MRTWLLAAIAAVSCLVYLNALANGFAFDDVAIIVENPRVHDLTALRAIWLTPYWPFSGAEFGLWRPLAIFGYALQWTLGGGAPVVFHATSIALHALVTVLAFLVLERLTATVPAFWGALVFAVHPVHTEVVANVVGQAELLVAATSLAAGLVFSSRPAGEPLSTRRTALVAMLFAASMLSKEHAVVLPALLVLLDVAQRRVRFSRAGLLSYSRALRAPMALMAAVLAAYLAVRFHVLEGSLLGVTAGPQLHYLHGDDRLLNALRVFPEMLRLLVWPASLSADYSPAMIVPVTQVTPMVAFGGATLALLIVLAALSLRTPALGVPAAWFLLSVLTVSNLLFPVGVLLAERTLYLASFAVSMGVSFAWFNTRHRWRRLHTVSMPAALTIVCVLGAAKTWTRNPDWASTTAVHHALVRDHPESYKAQWTQAVWERSRGHIGLARSHFDLALRIYPFDSDLRSDYADFLIEQGEFGSAANVMRAAFELHPQRPRVISLFGMALLGQGSHEAALAMARAAESAGHDPATVLPIMAAAFDALGRGDEALSVRRRAVQQADLPPRHWAQLADRLAAAGDTATALHAIARGLHAAGPDTTAVRQLRALEAALRP
jgi:protein O-mannosyl-transferase